jgi:YD repeat-containing protein
VREQFTWDDGVVIASTIHVPTVAQTAFRNRSWNFGDWFAWRVDETRTRTRTLLEDTQTWRWVETQTSYDSYGLPVEVKDLGDPDPLVTGDDVCTETDYARNTTPCLINFPSQVITTSCAATPSGSDYLSGSRTLYDGTTALHSPPTRGLVTWTTALASVSGTTLTWATSGKASHDEHGRIESAWDALNRLTTTAYTPTVGGPTTAVSVTNPAGHSSVSTVDLHRGLPTQTVDANNKTTRLTYDPLGRLLKVWLPGRQAPQTPNLEYTYLLRSTGANAVTTKKLGPDGNQIVSYDLYDGRLRLRQTQTRATTGRNIADIGYDNRSLTFKESMLWDSTTNPNDTLVTFADATVPRQIQHVYDHPGRETDNILLSSNIEQWRTTTSYHGDYTSMDPPAGDTPTTTHIDVRGRIVELRQYQGSGPSGAYDETGYGYDRLGKLTTVTDPAGNQWTWTYDLRGRTTATADPDKGTTTMTYDNAGQLLTSTDARGIVLATAYDNLGRRSRLHRDSVTSGPQLAGWTYDTLALGQLTSSTRYIGGVGGSAYTTAVTGYDDGYRPVGTSVTLPAVEGTLAGTWTTAMIYHPDGSPATIAYPAAGGQAAETVTYDYDSIGRPESVTGLASTSTTPPTTPSAANWPASTSAPTAPSSGWPTSTAPPPADPPASRSTPNNPGTPAPTPNVTTSTTAATPPGTSSKSSKNSPAPPSASMSTTSAGSSTPGPTTSTTAPPPPAL